MTLLNLATDPGERHPADTSGERAVSWTGYLIQECTRARALLAGGPAAAGEAAGGRFGASPRR